MGRKFLEVSSLCILYTGGKNDGYPIPTPATTTTNEFFRLAKRCTGSESSIEECGGVTVVRAEDCKRFGTLECTPGNHNTVYSYGAAWHSYYSES